MLLIERQELLQIKQKNQPVGIGIFLFYHYENMPIQIN